MNDKMKEAFFNILEQIIDEKINEKLNQATKEDGEKLLSSEEAAEILQIKHNTLQVWRSNDRYQIPYVKVGRNVKYRLSDLNNFIKERKRTHT